MRASFVLPVLLLGLAGMSTVIAEAEISDPPPVETTDPPDPVAEDPPAPVVEDPPAPVDEDPADPVEEETPAPVEEEPEVPIVEEPAAPIEEEPSVPDDATPPAPLDEAPVIEDGPAVEPVAVEDGTDGGEPSPPVPVCTPEQCEAGDVCPPGDCDGIPLQPVGGSPNPGEDSGAASPVTPPGDGEVSETGATTPTDPITTPSSESTDYDYVYVSTEGDEWIPDKYDYDEDAESAPDGDSGQGESSVFGGGEDDSVAETTRDASVVVEPGSGVGRKLWGGVGALVAAAAVFVM